MRIISGNFRGKKILEPKDLITRPLKDLAKESIFNIINHSNKFKIDLENSNILDLFSGVGSFGIECLSRGVKKVIFIENYNGVLPVLKKNLDELKLIENYQIIKKDIYNKNLFLKLESMFDIIFLDPPFKDKNIEKKDSRNFIINTINSTYIFIKNSQYGAHYNAAYKIYLAHPYFGIGIKNFRNESGDKKYDDLDHLHNTARWATHPHEIYYEFLSETGIFGFSCFIIFFLISISISIKNYLNYKNLYQLSGIIFVVVSLFPVLPSGSFLSTYTSSIFWLNYALMMGYNIKK